MPVMAAKCNGGVITAAALEYGFIGNGAYPGLPIVCNVSEKVSPINKNTLNHTRQRDNTFRTKIDVLYILRCVCFSVTSKLIRAPTV